MVTIRLLEAMGFLILQPGFSKYAGRGEVMPVKTTTSQQTARYGTAWMLLLIRIRVR
jgi:hypothetical protein